MNERVLSTLWERIRLYVSSFMEEWEGLSVANDADPGLVKPDGVTTVVDDDGTIHAIGAMSIPEYDSTDDGKVLMIQNGSIVWGNPSE